MINKVGFFETQYKNRQNHTEGTKEPS